MELGALFLLCKLSTEGAASLVLRLFTLNLINKLNSFIQMLTMHLLCRRMVEGVGDGNIPKQARFCSQGLACVLVVQRTS